jgi:hypothetical protein
VLLWRLGDAVTLAESRLVALATHSSAVLGDRQTQVSAVRPMIPINPAIVANAIV